MAGPRGALLCGFADNLTLHARRNGKQFSASAGGELLYFGGSVGAGIAGSRRLTQVPIPAWE